ncbi:MAG: HlyD family type I secretion periplasmic adaptor subunit [Pseudomonadota bacterium]
MGASRHSAIPPRCSSAYRNCARPRQKPGVNSLRYDQLEARRQDASAINKLVILGVATAIAVVAVSGFWAARTEIEGAVIANGTVVSQSDRKRIQHRYGGTIMAIHASNGDRVRKGQSLVQLDGTELLAELTILRKRTLELHARRHRLDIERSGDVWRPLSMALAVEMDLVDEAKALAQFQKKQFETRTKVRQSRVSQLRERIAQFRNEDEGLNALWRARQKEAEILSKELKDLGGLNRKGLVQVSRFNALARANAEKSGQVGETEANIARVKGRISETQMQIIELLDGNRTRVLEELEKTNEELSKLEETRRALRARVEKLNIVASDDGYIHELSVTTIGGVVAPGETIAFLVPSGEELEIDGQVGINDRDRISIGMPIRVRFPAFNSRETPELQGILANIGSDQSKSEDNRPYYKVRVRLNVSDQKTHRLKLIPGMPAELIMTTGGRTVISFLSKPLTDQFHRAFREQ